MTFIGMPIAYDAANSNVGTGTCGASGTLTATFGPVEVLSSSNGTPVGQLVYSGT